MSTKLYHREVGPGIPKSEALKRMFGVSWHLHYSGHAMRECIHDKHGIIRMPPQAVTFSLSDVVELELDYSYPANPLMKMVIRIPYCDSRDLVLVLTSFEPGLKECRVKSVWTNLKSDTHSTLDTKRYVGA